MAAYTRNILLSILFYTGVLMAQSDRPPATALSDTFNSVVFSLIRIPGGTFQMGDAAGSSSEQPVHPVTIRTFWMAETEVTQALYQAVMGKNPSYGTNCDQCPVEQVSWLDTQVFLGKLNEKTGKTYRLPTEAEWEYAAGGGSDPAPARSPSGVEGKTGGVEGKTGGAGGTGGGTETGAELSWQGRTRWAGTNLADSLSLYACTGDNCLKTKLVKSFKPNALGLFDMSGNVWEWCQDWYAEDYYAKSPAENPAGPVKGQYRTCRGGAWIVRTPDQMTVSRRNYLMPDAGNNRVGFRICLSS